MSNYFWLEGDDVPDGIGFGLFTWKHFLADAVCLAGVAVFCAFFYHRSYSGQKKTLRITAIALLLGNLARDVFLALIGHMSIAYLPLHLCSFAIFVYLLHAFLPERMEKGKIVQSRFREALGEIGYVLLMPGTVCALLFPDWYRYPIWNFMSLHSFIWHAVLIAYPMMLRISGRIHPEIRHIWYPVVYLLVITPPIFAFDRKFDVNYLFVNWPLPETPLEWLYNAMGAYWRVGYAILVFIVVLCIYLAIELVRRIRKAFS